MSPRVVLGLAVVLSLGGPGARAQQPAGPPPVPDPAPAATAGATVEERLRRLEEANERILRENEALRTQVRTLTERLGDRDAPAAGAGRIAGDEPGNLSESNLPDDLASGPNIEPEIGFGGTPAQPAAPFEAGPKRKNPLYADFDKGFYLQSENEEFLLRFSNETQVEGRVFAPSGQASAHDGLFIPRQIWAFSGRVTKPIEFSVSINKGLGDINLRDAYLNFHYDDRLMVRFGRYRVPYTYEFYATSNVDLLAPERSVFAVNYGLNRQIGLMGWGELLEKRVDYAVGLFNGPRNGFEDFNDPKDIIAYFNARPFELSERWPALRYLNLGASVDYGRQDNPLRPRALRTAVNASNSEGAATSSPAFLSFNDDVTEFGPRELWNLHLAYFWRGLSLLAEWDSGFASYAKAGATAPVHVPVGGYYVQAGYVLTGEWLEKRVVIDPIRPFDLRRGKFGIGAWEVHARYAQLNVGNQVFAAGLVDPNLWANEVGVVDLGWNWYLNRYMKIYFDWQHAAYGRPVLLNAGRLQPASNLFWIRCQLYF